MGDEINEGVDEQRECGLEIDAVCGEDKICVCRKACWFLRAPLGRVNGCGSRKRWVTHQLYSSTVTRSVRLLRATFVCMMPSSGLTKRVGVIIQRLIVDTYVRLVCDPDVCGAELGSDEADEPCAAAELDDGLACDASSTADEVRGEHL